MSVRINLSIAASFAFALGLLGCGSSGRGSPVDAGHTITDTGVHLDFGMAGDLGPGHDSGGPATDLGIGHDSGPTMTDAGMVCTASCTVNADCTRTCPMMTGRSECCDAPTHRCFPVTGMCPAAVDAGSGTDASMY